MFLFASVCTTVQWFCPSAHCGQSLFNTRSIVFPFMLQKLGCVADYEGRSINSHVPVLIRQRIQSFKEKYGRIEGPIQPDSDVKPPKK